ncbi:hypothetical protein [Desulfovibrio sp. TomC]|uniref:hypothetical protein n=1 Tax=Desulfovibrio sp. TomC TaxID=1562888 RepID=UPI0005740262|nr:hypothetical protein [Desulfovibrio sp. TomC]KHK02062.1 hypothetical protein NY78_2546 [Desulfovibrio sp. TomC]
MQIVIRSGFVTGWHSDGQDLTVVTGYRGCLILTVPDDTPVAIGQPWEADLDAARQSVCAELDAMAERLRNTVLTPGSGQMAAYQAKEIQAAALLLDPTPTEAEYPDIFNEIGITAPSAGEVAMAVRAAAEKWRTYGRAVERARLAGKKAVGEASDVAGVLAARATVNWPQC